MTKKQKTPEKLSANELANFVHRTKANEQAAKRMSREGLDIFIADSDKWGPCDFCSREDDKKVTIVKGELGMRQVRFCKKCMGELAEYFNGYL